MSTVTRKRSRNTINDPLMSVPDFFVIKQVRGKTIFNNGSEIQYKGVRNRENAARYFYNTLKKNTNILNDPSPGVYTWILKQIDDRDYFIAAKTISNQEIGSLHINLDKLTKGDKKNVKAAGELLLTADNVIYFNLSSGTYMATKSANNITSAKERVIKHLESLIYLGEKPFENKVFFLDNELASSINIDNKIKEINDVSGYDYIIPSKEHNAPILPNEEITGYQLLERFTIISRVNNKNTFNAYLKYNTTNKTNKANKK
jgi:hypothetical protein